jgi:hypothetical protein
MHCAIADDDDDGGDGDGDGDGDDDYDDDDAALIKAHSLWLGTIIAAPVYLPDPPSIPPFNA